MKLRAVLFVLVLAIPPYGVSARSDDQRGIRVAIDMPAGLKRMLAQDLMFLRDMPSDLRPSEMSVKFYGPGEHDTGLRYFNYLLDNVKKIGLLDCGGFTACVRWDGDSDTIFLNLESPEWYRNNYRGMRLSILIHEATHLSNRIKHVNCPDNRKYYDPKMIGENSCDKNHRGAYGHQLVFLNSYKNNCKDCSAAEIAWVEYALKSYKTLILKNSELTN